ncbi:hypothetical protein DF153_07480 [Burkholderia cenocepacia]|nr:hypothetical protein DF152_09560 [Burkholderia cenocepacia]RQU26486.1 hypothetical protein DF153_07480 [Burkholderia cenocepacia]
MRLRTAGCGRPVADGRLRTAGCGRPVADGRLRTAGCGRRGISLGNTAVRPLTCVTAKRVTRTAGMARCLT